MNHVFWLIPGKLAGRPGPDREPWKLASLREAGIGAVLSVNDGFLCYPEDFEAAGLAYACVPFPDRAPPAPGDDDLCLRALPRARAFIVDQLDRGRTTLVHCASGKDRTGLVLAYHFMLETGATPEAAVAEIRRVRPIALSAPGWYDLALDLLARV
ncbi:MAG: tyrosine-protein phosphatase [Byssovorax sp.]